MPATAGRARSPSAPHSGAPRVRASTDAALPQRRQGIGTRKPIRPACRDGCAPPCSARLHVDSAHRDYIDDCLTRNLAVARRSRSETSSDLILKTCASFPPPRPPPLRDVIWRAFSRLHRRRLDEEPRGGAEITERDVCGFDLENLLPLPASATSASPRCNLESLFKITFARHSNGLPGVPSRSRRRRLDGCAPPRSAIGHRM